MTLFGCEHPKDQTDRPFWSVMIPAYNPDIPLLRLAVDSVLCAGLNGSDYQLAIVDDASTTTNVNAFYDEMERKGVAIFRNRARAGLVGNWNVCIQHARGRWIHILHQDDRVRPGFYHAMEAGINSMPSLGAAFSQIEFIDEAGAFLRHGHMTQKEPGVVHSWIENIMVNLVAQCPGMVVRREVYERLGGFDVSFTYNADQEMWQRIAAQYPIWYEPKPLAEYRVHKASATHQLYDLPHRWTERRTSLNRGLGLLSPLIRERVRYSGEYYRTCLAWHELVDAWRAESNPLARVMLLPLMLRMGDLRHLWSRRRRKYPRPIPGSAPVRGSDPVSDREKRILFLSEFYPADTLRSIYGVFQRMRSMMAACSKAGHVDVLFFWSNNYQVPEYQALIYRDEMKNAAWPFAGDLLFIATSAGAGSERRRQPIRTLLWLLRGVATFMHNQPTMRSCGIKQVNKLRDVLLRYQPDLIFIHRMGAAGALSRVGLDLPPVVIDLDDVEHVKLSRMHAGVKRWKDILAVKVWTFIARQAERRSCRLADMVFVCSETDQKELSRVVRRANIHVVPNVGSGGMAPLPLTDQPSALFVGIAHYPPNREAIELLVREIWPRVREQMPDAMLHILGQASALVASSSKANGIRVWGFVPEIEPYYRDVAIAVCPIMKGSGTRIKIIEAALLGRPSVSTTVGAEGLNFVPGSEIVIADDVTEFADAVVKLLSDQNLRKAMGEAARKKAWALYNPDIVMRDVAAMLHDIMEKGPSL